VPRPATYNPALDYRCPILAEHKLRSKSTERHKTNSMRLLDSRRISYEVHEFPSDTHSAEGAAELLGVPACRVYKTLVVVREKGRPVLVMVPGDATLDLKLLARSIGDKKLRMASHREAEDITGLEVGGISTLALTGRGFDVYAHEDILSLPVVYVSAGRRGIDLGLRPSDLLEVTKAKPVAAVGAR
jgi:Cys-tRNA(Pro)/Cys-tRNA(Cys) deacylase